MARRVILVCGPPGAGKTTYARTLGLPVYDIDDPQWRGSETRFRQALRALGRTPDAQAAVIRSAATPTARGAHAALIGATDIKILAVDAGTCIERVVQRGRTRPPLPTQIAAVGSWWQRYQPGIQLPSLRSARDQRTTTEKGLGYAHQALRRRLLPKAYGQACPLCGDLMLKGQDLDLDHATARVLGGKAGEGRMAHRHCNRSQGSKLGAALRRTKRLPKTRIRSRRW